MRCARLAVGSRCCAVRHVCLLGLCFQALAFCAGTRIRFGMACSPCPGPIGPLSTVCKPESAQSADPYAERMSALIMDDGKRQEVSNIADQAGAGAGRAGLLLAIWWACSRRSTAPLPRRLEMRIVPSAPPCLTLQNLANPGRPPHHSGCLSSSNVLESPFCHNERTRLPPLPLQALASFIIIQAAFRM